MAMSMRCMAKINSSAVSFPSWSMSDKLLKNEVIKQKNLNYNKVNLKVNVN